MYFHDDERVRVRLKVIISGIMGMEIRNMRVGEKGKREESLMGTRIRILIVGGEGKLYPSCMG